MSSRWVLHAITFVFVFGWKATAMLDLVLLTSIALVCHGVVKHGPGRLVYDHVGAGVYVLFAWSLAVAAAFLPDDLFFVARNLRAWVNFAGAAYLAVLFVEVHGSPRRGLDAALTSLALAISLHALIVMTMFAVPELRERIYALTSAAEYANETTSFGEGFRITGLTYGLSQTSMLHAFGALIAFSRWVGASSGWRRLGWLLAFLLQGGSIFIIGRSGLMFLAVGLLAVLGHSLLTGSLSRTVGRLVSIAGLAVGATLLLLGGDLIGSASQDRESTIGRLSTYTVDHSSEVLEVLITGESHTTQYVADGLFAPDDLRTMIVGGEGSGRGPGRYLDSDSGYVKIWFGLGLVGCVISVYIYIIALWPAYRLGWREPAVFLFVLYVVALMAFNVKELALLTRNQWSVITLLYWLTRSLAIESTPPREVSVTKPDTSSPAPQAA
jgi:hypothetical protein